MKRERRRGPRVLVVAPNLDEPCGFLDDDDAGWIDTDTGAGASRAPQYQSRRSGQARGGLPSLTGGFYCGQRDDGLPIPNRAGPMGGSPDQEGDFRRAEKLSSSSAPSAISAPLAVVQVLRRTCYMLCPVDCRIHAQGSIGEGPGPAQRPKPGNTLKSRPRKTRHRRSTARIPLGRF